MRHCITAWAARTFHIWERDESFIYLAGICLVRGWLQELISVLSSLMCALGIELTLSGLAASFLPTESLTAPTKNLEDKKVAHFRVLCPWGRRSFDWTLWPWWLWLLLKGVLDHVFILGREWNLLGQRDIAFFWWLPCSWWWPSSGGDHASGGRT